MPPQQAINAGFERAFVTILDANLTTLIVAVILYSIGTGPVKGFAVTLSIGILTSMFTAIVGTRAIVNLMYGGRKVERLAI
jgi:preprotein translocase subunit SecD